jgi:uncharacterized YccA/Bax inhibitor family protein
MNSNNPFLNKAFDKSKEGNIQINQTIFINDSDNAMTIGGTMNKSFILLGLLMFSAYFTWTNIASFPFPPMAVIIGSAILAFGLVLISAFKPTASPYIAPSYALFEGVFLGSISLFFNQMYPGIVLNAVCATMITFITMFLLYRTGVVRATEKFKSVVIGATLAIGVFYLMNLILFFVFKIEPISWGNSWLSIGISVFVVIIAALNLILDFDAIEEGSKNSMPKYMEWYSAMGLMITLVWLYIEILRLLSKLNSRD